MPSQAVLLQEVRQEWAHEERLLANVDGKGRGAAARHRSCVKGAATSNAPTSDEPTCYEPTCDEHASDEPAGDVPTSGAPTSDAPTSDGPASANTITATHLYKDFRLRVMERAAQLVAEQMLQQPLSSHSMAY